MKENMVDILMFLFDNYLNVEEGMPQDEVALACELEEAGFHAKDITKAFDWLGGLADIRNSELALLKSPGKAIRFYLPQEQTKLDVACRGFLQELEKLGLLDTPTREIIIDRAMALDVETLDLLQFKRVVGLVMVNSGWIEDLAWIEDLIYNEKGAVH